MATRWLYVCGIVLIVMIAVGGAAYAETGGTNADLPDAVAKAFHDRFPGGEITSTDTQKSEGVQIYDLEFKVGTAEWDCAIALDGTFLDTSVVMDAKSVPEAAMRAIEKAAAGGKIVHIWKLEIFADPKAGKLVKLDKARIEYEAELEKSGSGASVVVGEDGAVIEAPQWIKESEKNNKK
jgi:hypothetical protein